MSTIYLSYCFGISSPQANLGQQPGPEMNENERLIMVTKFENVKNRLLSPVHFQTISHPQLLPVIAIRPISFILWLYYPKKISYPNRLITPIFPISF